MYTDEDHDDSDIGDEDAAATAAAAAADGGAAAGGATAGGGAGDPRDTRRERNRLAAKRCRERKTAHLAALESALAKQVAANKVRAGPPCACVCVCVR